MHCSLAVTARDKADAVFIRDGLSPDYAVEIVDPASAALHVTDAEHFAVIIVGRGDEADIALISSIREASRITVIFAGVPNALLARALDAGADEVVPLERGDVIARLKAALGACGPNGAGNSALAGDPSEQLRLIIDNVNGGVTATVIDEDSTRFLFTNAQYYAQLGYTKAQYEAEVASAFAPVHPDDRARVIGETRLANADSRPFTIEYRVIRRDGEVRWLRSNVAMTVFPGVRGRVQLAVANDITEIIDVQSRLRESSERLSAIVKNIASGVTAVILHDDSSITPIFMTDKYYELLGYTREQFESELKVAFEPIHPDDIGWVLPKIREIYDSGETATLEFRARRRDGRVIWLRDVISLAHFDNVGVPVQLSVFTDITESRNLTEQLNILAQSVPGGLATVELTSDSVKMLYFNDGFYKYTGYTREEYANIVKDNPLHFVLLSDVPMMRAAFSRILSGESETQCTYRCRAKDGTNHWFEFKGIIIERGIGSAKVNLIRVDITERKESEEKLRISEEQFRVAASLGDRAVARYDINTGLYTHNDKILRSLGYGDTVKNVPQAFLSAGIIAPECVNEYIQFYDKLRRGAQYCVVDTAIKSVDGKYRWYRREATVIFDERGMPYQAIIVGNDITEQRSREAVYIAWQQSLMDKAPDSYTLFRWNLTKDVMIEAPEGTLLRLPVIPSSPKFNTRTLEYAMNFIAAEDREAYIEFANMDSLLVDYYRGKRYQTIEYRELMPDKQVRWLSLTAELLEYPNSADVCVFLMYENVDEKKRMELQSKELAENDPLTGVQNRATFARSMDALIHKYPRSKHAFLVLDVDGFKLVNDLLGHAAGDQALIDIADALRSIAGRDDLVGRLGGDEFFMCLKDVSFGADIEKRAADICAVVRRAFSLEVQISLSVGIALYPNDGCDFETLYRKADAALYMVKESGKDNYGFYTDDKMEASAIGGGETADAPGQSDVAGPRRLLVIANGSDMRRRLTDMLSDEYLVENASDSGTALIRIRHYSLSIAAVLLDVSMPGGDGFGVLEKMRANAETRLIPVIAVCGADDIEQSVKAIELGAADYIAMPIDERLLGAKIRAVIGKAENEKQHSKDSYALMHAGEDSRYRAALSNTGTVFVEYDWLTGKFAYDEDITKYIAGRYNRRKLWLVLLSDMVADVMDVKAMQDLVRRIANDRQSDSGSMNVMLNTPSNVRHWFRFSVTKRANDFGLTSKLYLTFRDINADMRELEKARGMAEYDAFSGLFNYQTFSKRARDMLMSKSANHYVVIVISADSFKKTCEERSCAAGEALLRQLSDKLRADFSLGGLCARLLGDTFAVLTPYSPVLIDRLFGYPLEISAESGRAEYSIGFYIADEPDAPIDLILARALIARRAASGNNYANVVKYVRGME